MERYARQIILPEIGETGQQKLLAASTLVIGAGGLGCPALLYLAAAGIGRIGIIDHDTVDESNLQRQMLYSTAQIGQSKVISAKERLSALNPEIKIDVHPEKLTADNAVDLFKSYDIIIDGTDNFTAKYIINDAALIAKKPYIYASILGFNGQIATFNHGENAPCYRCLFPDRPTQGVKNCAEAGIIGAVAGIIGTQQALEAIKIITGLPTLSGKLSTYDALTGTQKIITLHKDPNCNHEDITMQNDEISVAETQANTTAILIDVREQDEWNAGHIEGAELLPLSQIMHGARPSHAKDTEIVLYCRSGKRSMDALNMLRADGYTNLKNMSGGILAWNQFA